MLLLQSVGGEKGAQLMTASCFVVLEAKLKDEASP
jgi:hypothetical protein